MKESSKGADNIIEFTGKIKNLDYNPTFEIKDLISYDLNSFDINESRAFGLIKVDKNNSIAYSKWVSPKRTRSYPLSRIYNTYCTKGKIVTVIPVIKDEGIKGDLDRINFITLSWLNLMNVYIILAWYDGADKEGEEKITKQRFNNQYVDKKIKEILNFKLDAHHWNNRHFEEDFKEILENSIKSYNEISKSLSVSLHSRSNDTSFLNSLLDDREKFNINLFREKTLTASQMAAVRESKTNHKKESLSKDSKKCIFKIRNNLGGIYHLTADEVIFQGNEKIIIQESKNTTNNTLPSEDDIKDGLFKLILLSNIDELKYKNKKVDFETRLRITGNFKDSLKLPTNKPEIIEFCNKNKLENKDIQLLNDLDRESRENKFYVMIDS